jgi:hypothetical protein
MVRFMSYIRVKRVNLASLLRTGMISLLYKTEEPLYLFWDFRSITQMVSISIKGLCKANAKIKE